MTVKHFRHLKNKGMKNGELKVKPEKVIAILEKTGGTIYPAAKMLKVSRGTLYNYINSNDEIKEALEEIRESLLDVAEAKLHSNIQDGKEASIFFYLKTQGKSRGYEQQLGLKHSGHVTAFSDLTDQEIDEKIIMLDTKLSEIDELRGK